MNNFSLQRIPFISIIVPFASGILIGTNFEITLFISWLSFWMLGLVVFVFWKRIYLPIIWYGSITIWLCLMGIILGVFESNRYNSTQTIEGIFDVEVLNVNQHRILVQEDQLGKGYLNASHCSFNKGDKVKFLGKADRVQDFKKTNFSFKNYAYCQGVRWYFKLYRLDSLSQTKQVLSLKEKVVLSITQNFTANHSGVLIALITGKKNLLDNKTKDLYGRLGLQHVLVVSGLHIGMLYLLIYWVVSRLFCKRYIWLGKLFPLVITWLFALWCEMGPPVLRAVMMLNLVVLGQLINRRIHALNILLFVAFCMLFFQPYLLYDTGFQMSFSAVASILIIYKPFEKSWYPPNIIFRYIWKSLVLTFSIHLGMAPILMHNFSSFSLLAFLGNLLVLPFIPVILFLSIFYVAFYHFQWFLAEWIHHVLVLLMNGITYLAEVVEPWSILYEWELAMELKDVYAYYIILTIFALYYIHRNWNLVRLNMLCILLWSIVNLKIPI